jgi:hypothetical protein
MYSQILLANANTHGAVVIAAESLLTRKSQWTP